MATTVLGNSNLTLLDRVKRVDPDGQPAKVIEALTQRNPILKDAVANEGNLPTGHRLTIRSGLPTVGYRMINQGIDASVSRTVQVDETCALLEGRSEVDCELARLGGNEAGFRAQEDVSFVQSMSNQVAGDLFYASTKTDPAQFHGIFPRYDSLAGNDNSENVLDAGFVTPDGSNPGDQSSMMFLNGTLNPPTP